MASTSNTDIAEAADIQASPATLLRKHYHFQDGCFISEQKECFGGILAYSTVTPVPMWNHAAWIGGTDSEFEDFINRAQEWQLGKNRRPVLYVAEPTAAQSSALLAAGFEKFDEEAWMTDDSSLGDFHQEPAVREVTTPDLLQQFTETFSTSFQIKESGYRTVLSAAPRGGVSSRHFLLSDASGKAASIGTLVTDGKIACIYNIGTPAQQRQKGYGRRVFEHIVAVAREAGCEVTYLQVEKNSGAMRLYEKSGFRTAFTRIGYRKASWQPLSTERTRLSNVLGHRTRHGETPRYLRETRAIAGFSRATPNPSTMPSIKHLCVAAWACVVHRYIGEETVHFSISEGSTPEPQPISISIEPEKAVRQWIWELEFRAAPSDSDAHESLLLINSGNLSSHLDNSRFPLAVHAQTVSGIVEIIYRSDLFSKDAIRRMAAHFANAIQALTVRAPLRVTDIEILSAEEKHQLLVDWNQNGFRPVSETIVQLFESRVERSPDATAVLLAKSGESQAPEQITYRQLNRKANRLAHHLKELGVEAGTFVGICLDRTPNLIVALLAVLKAGGACVPLDPSYPVDRLRFMLQDTNAPVVLTHREFLPLLRGATHARIVSLDEEQPHKRLEAEKNPSHDTDVQSPAYIIFTSGSTGKPKGVVVSNYALANHSMDCCATYGLSSKDRVLQFSSFNFDAAFEQIFPALISGAVLVMRDNEVWSTREFASKMRDLQLTVADIPTAYWHQLAAEWSTEPASVPQNCLRLVIVGGEALAAEKVALWQRTPLNEVRLINAYGPTEAVITATSYEISAPNGTDLEAEVVPIGRPRADRKLYVLDRHGNPTPIGIPGELHIGGSLLAQGYHRRPDLTMARFIPNPFSDESEARLYRTGDLVRYLEDGNLEFLGRIDDQVKIRGFRIELGEIESCLSRHPLVRDTIVQARSTASGEKQLVAYIIPNGEAAIADFRSHIKSKLPEYMLPSRFVLLDKWPLLPNGKVDRRNLPEPPKESDHQSIKGPEDPLDLQLQLLFERVLKRAPIGVDVSFFELGGDSLQALELLVEIEKSTGKQLPLGTLYQSSTVESLAREIRSRRAEQAWSSLVPLQVSGKRSPLFLLHTTPGDILGYGNLVYRLDTDQPCYGFQSVGLKEARLSHTSIAEMAAYYTDLLRQFQPKGPYYLGGWCYGGIVAVEMARVLQHQGQKVALLALLETVAMPARLTNYKYHQHRLRCFLRMSPQRWLTYFRSKAKYARESRIANRMRFRQADSSADGELRDPRLAKLEHVYNTNLAALEGYRTEYYDGKVTLFNAAERDPALIPDPHYGWVGLARQVEIHDVPGNHDTMLTEPNVSALAECLNDCLLRAQTQF